MVAPIGRVGASTEASLVLAQLGGIDGRPLDSDRLKGRGMKQSCFRTHLYECLYSRHVPVQPDLASPITYPQPKMLPVCTIPYLLRSRPRPTTKEIRVLK